MRHGGTHESFGIDLGTTYSAVATIDDYDRATIVPNDINEPTTPSVLYFESPEHVVVGVEAKNMAEIEPERVVQFVKALHGRNDEFLFEFAGKAYQPEELSALILKALVEKHGKTCKRRSRTWSSPFRRTSTMPSAPPPKMRERWRG